MSHHGEETITRNARSSVCFEALADALHAISQPLMTLNFSAEIARMSADPEEWSKALDNIRQQSERAAAALSRARNATEALGRFLREAEVQP